MAQFLNKGDHIFIPFGMFGMSLGYKGPYIYKSIQTAMANYGKDADEVVEYAPIVRCGIVSTLYQKKTLELTTGKESVCTTTAMLIQTTFAVGEKGGHHEINQSH